MAVDRPGGAAPNGTGLTHSERLAETRRLLNAAAASQDPDERRGALTEVAALHADDALVLVRTLYRHRQRQPGGEEQESESALLAYALEAYVDAVLALDPTTEGDVLPQVLPAVRDAVVRFSRQQVSASAAPRVGVRSGLR